ncbi:hypothetical protein EV715DRAFT_298057 [Schizophyllum commune]
MADLGPEGLGGSRWQVFLPLSTLTLPTLIHPLLRTPVGHFVSVRLCRSTVTFVIRASSSHTFSLRNSHPSISPTTTARLCVYDDLVTDVTAIAGTAINVSARLAREGIDLVGAGASQERALDYAHDDDTENPANCTTTNYADNIAALYQHSVAGLKDLAEWWGRTGRRETRRAMSALDPLQQPQFGEIYDP